MGSVEPKQEVLTEKLPWIWVIASAVILTALGTAWIAFQQPVPANQYFQWGPSSCGLVMANGPFYILLLTAPLMAIKTIRPKINKRTLIYGYIVASITAVWTQFWWPWGRTPLLEWVGMRDGPENVRSFLPDIQLPPQSVAAQITSGGVPIPWGVWLPITLWTWFINFLPVLFFLGIASILRRQVIDVERLPYPHVQLAYELSQNVSLIGSGKTNPGSRKRMFLLGIIIGIAFELPLSLRMTFPWFPDIFGWKVNTCRTGFQYITTDSPLFASIPGFSGFNKDPMVVAVLYLVPLTTLFNIWFWFLIYLVLAQVSFAMGYYTDILTKNGCGRMWCPPIPALSSPLYLMAFTCGTLYFYSGMSLWLERKHIMATLRSAFGKVKVDNEVMEPMSYRSAWLLFLGSAVVIFIYYSAEGMGYWLPIILLLGWFFYSNADMRIIGLAAQPHNLTGELVFIRFAGLPPPSEQPREWIYANYETQEWNLLNPRADQVYATMNSLKMNSMTHSISNKNITKTIIITNAIAIFVSIIVALMLLYTYGQSRLSIAMTYSTNTNLQEWYASLYNYPGQGSPYWTWGQMTIAGGLLGLFFTYMHASFVWFPFEPVGFIIGFSSWNTLQHGYWSVALVAWIIKNITFRVGGSKLYENDGVPIASGAISGMMLVFFFSGIAGIYRFFIPF